MRETFDPAKAESYPPNIQALGFDTLWIMDMKQEFARGRDWVANNLTMDACAS